MIDELSIIIPTLNEENYLTKLLQSITEQNFKGNLQVIVVDGKSEDKTVALAEKFTNIIPGLEILQTKRNIDYQCNRGAEKAKYDLLLFLDADVILPKNCLSSLTLKINSNKRFIASVFHQSSDHNLIDNIFVCVAFGLFFIAKVIGSPVVPGDFILTTKENHKKIGGFKEGAVLGEDIDYCLRSYRSGAKYHLYLGTRILGSPRRARKIGRLKLLITWIRSFLYVRKHGPIYDKNYLKYLYIRD